MVKRNWIWSDFLLLVFFLQSIPEENGDSNNPESEGTAFLPVQPSTSEGELKLHLSDDEEDDDDEEEEEEFDNEYDKTAEEEEAEEEDDEEGQDLAEQDELQPEVDEDQEQVQGEETGEQEAESDTTPAPGVPEQEDPEAVALKKRT